MQGPKPWSSTTLHLQLQLLSALLQKGAILNERRLLNSAIYEVVSSCLLAWWDVTEGVSRFLRSEMVRKAKDGRAIPTQWSTVFGYLIFVMQAYWFLLSSIMFLFEPLWRFMMDSRPVQWFQGWGVWDTITEMIYKHKTSKDYLLPS
jgi:hypothetical protein